MRSSNGQEFKNSIQQIFKTDKVTPSRPSRYDATQRRDTLHLSEGLGSNRGLQKPSIRVIPLSTEYGGVESASPSPGIATSRSEKYSLSSLKKPNKFGSRRVSHFNLKTHYEPTDVWEPFNTFEIESKPAPELKISSVPILRLLDKLLKDVSISVECPVRLKLDAQGKNFPLKFMSRDTVVPQLIVTYAFDTVPSKENSALHKSEVGKSSFLITGPQDTRYVGLLLEVTSGFLSTQVGCSFKSNRQQGAIKLKNHSATDISSHAARTNRGGFQVDPLTKLPIINYKEFLEFSVDIPDRSELEERQRTNRSLQKLRNLTNIPRATDFPAPTYRLEPLHPQTSPTDAPPTPTPAPWDHVSLNKVIAGHFRSFGRFSREQFLQHQQQRHTQALTNRTLQQQQTHHSSKPQLSARNATLREAVDAH